MKKFIAVFVCSLKEPRHKCRVTGCVLSLLFISSSIFSQTERTIEVFGNAEIRIVPDKLILSINIRKEGNDVQSLKRSVDISTSEVISILKSENIPDKDIKTSGVSIHNNYIPPERTESIRRFTAFNNITFTLNDISKYERLTDRMIEIENVFLNSPVFQSTKEIETRNQAREDALLAARTKAENMASTLGIRIGRVMNVYELSSNIYYPNPFNVSTEMRQQSYSETSSFMEGQIIISAQVKLIFELLD
jgi:uncharacterized protein